MAAFNNLGVGHERPQCYREPAYRARDILAAAPANIAVISGLKFARRNRLLVQTGANAEFGRSRTLSALRRAP